MNGNIGRDGYKNCQDWAISSETAYQSSESKRSKLSEDTVRWVCQEYQNGKTAHQVFKSSQNPNIQLHQLEDIKRRRGYRHILKDYTW